MSDPHTLLDTYAAGTSGLGTTEEAAPEAIAALRKVLDVADNWGQGECLTGYRITDGDDTDSECLHCAAEAIRRAITTALGGDEK